MQQQLLPHEEEALAEERMQLHRDRLALQQDRERFEREFRMRAPRRYRLLAWLTDLWVAWLAARLLKWLIPFGTGETWFLLMYLLITAGMTYRYGQSLGKMAFELRTVVDNGEKPGLFPLLLRETVGRLVTVVSGFGMIFPFFNERQKAIHDLMAATTVISAETVEERYHRRGA